jgi:hypothetical protein
MSRRVFPVWILLSLGVFCGTAANAFPIAPPGTEGKLVIVANSGAIVATYQGNSATYSNDLFLMLDGSGNPGDDGNPANDLFVFNNHTSPVGSTKNLGSFPVGTELEFRLFVHNTGYHYFTGPASRNPDNKEHARVQENWQPNETLVSFEDLFGTPEGAGGYNDLSFSFTNTCTNAPPVASGFPAGGTINMCNVAEKSLTLSTGFDSPEADQITTTVVTTDLPPARYTLTNTPGKSSSQTLDFFPILSDLNHVYNVSYVATDNSPCPQSTTVHVTINLDPANCPTPAKRVTWGSVKRYYR